MRRFMTSLVLFCLLCGGGLMLLGSKFGAERSIETTTPDGGTMQVSLFDGNGVFVTFGTNGTNHMRVETSGAHVEIPDIPDVPDIPEIPGGPEAVNADLSGKVITQLNVYAALGEVTIQSGDSWAVSLNGADSSYEVSGEYLEVSANMGDVVVTVPRGTRLEYLSVDSEAGSVTLEDMETDFLELTQDLGETTLKNCSWSSADIDNGCGTIKGTGLTSEYLDVSADMGEVNLQGGFTGETDVEANAGSVSLKLSGSQADYDIELESNLGGVTLNGRGSGRTISQSGGPHSLDVSCDVGSIDVQFAS